MRIPEVPDTFNVGRKMKHFAYASPTERWKLHRYLCNFVRECEREDRKLTAFRTTWS
jgi:hypothetical protein